MCRGTGAVVLRLQGSRWPMLSTAVEGEGEREGREGREGCVCVAREGPKGGIEKTNGQTGKKGSVSPPSLRDTNGGLSPGSPQTTGHGWFKTAGSGMPLVGEGGLASNKPLDQAQDRVPNDGQDRGSISRPGPQRGSGGNSGGSVWLGWRMGATLVPFEPSWAIRDGLQPTDSPIDWRAVVRAREDACLAFAAR